MVEFMEFGGEDRMSNFAAAIVLLASVGDRCEPQVFSDVNLWAIFLLIIQHPTSYPLLDCVLSSLCVFK